MKVKELIEKLKETDQEKEVVFMRRGEGIEIDIDGVTEGEIRPEQQGVLIYWDLLSTP